MGKLNKRFEPIPLYGTPCKNCSKLIKDHFDGYCERQKPVVTSPLSDDELVKVACKGSMSGAEYRRAIANAAHARCLQDEAKAREELIARYDSLQSQYAELSVALDSAQHNNAERKKQDELILEALNAAQDEYSDAAKAYLIKIATEILEARTK